MNVLVTGSKGFIGKNLISRLKYVDNINIIEFDKTDSFDLIKKQINDIDFIFHFAGVNRPKETNEFYEGNTNLTKRIVDLLKKNNCSIPILYTSSIQAELDNDYGKSKLEAEKVLMSYKNSIIYRLHNVFGKWCRPNYNSVVATFCYNISHNIDINIIEPAKKIELVYIDDIIDTFVKELSKNRSRVSKNIKYIRPRYKISIGKLSDMLFDFKNSMDGIYVPKTGDDFTKKLFSTYISYNDLDKMICDLKSNYDERGSFTELIKTNFDGQFSVSVSKPGIVRGNHYHHTKVERFIVVKGTAKIKFRNIVSNETKEFIVDDTNLKFVTIPIGYTHSIENIGQDEMILFIWCNEIFDKSRPDTYVKEVE